MVEGSLELGELVLAADERRVEAARDELGALDEPVEAEGGDRLRLALGVERLDRLGPDRVADEPVGRLAEQRLARRGALLQPGGDVDRVAGGERVALAGDDLARVDADPALDP